MNIILILEVMVGHGYVLRCYKYRNISLMLISFPRAHAALRSGKLLLAFMIPRGQKQAYEKKLDTIQSFRQGGFANS